MLSRENFSRYRRELDEAIKQYDANETPETRARLEAAILRMKAAIDQKKAERLLWLVPVALLVPLILGLALVVLVATL